uniref:ErfK/YbiS/YcfS/YnhG family protein n=1 Tax=Xylanimonas cellulosilytica (strain DSM 15894 / JCM 12276 / CECT 5975 / KCTC 9989 / LMG 20990 / NBRC 107835 / XIL07) TaxID=446471 RepID=UPI0003C63E8B
SNAEPPAPQYPQRGSTGPEVLALQQRLMDLGYFILKADGDYGWATQQAVWAFQKAAGLYRDGVVGPQTQAALDAGYRPTPRSSSGKVVEIDLDKQILLAVEDGRVVRIINASSGNGETYEAKGRTYRATTPRGDFAVYMQRDGMHSSTLELGDMWRPKYFRGGYAVHGSSSIPTYPASHGCVRVSNAAMNWLWDSWGMPIGTRVLLY